MSTRYLKPADVRAMVVYLRSVTRIAATDLPAPKSTPAPAAHPLAGKDDFAQRGQLIYAGACAGCHGWTGVTSLVPLASLTGCRTVNDPTAINVAQVIMHGAKRASSDPTRNMPAFGDTYTNDEVASIANFVIARYGAQASELTAGRVAQLRRED